MLAELFSFFILLLFLLFLFNVLTHIDQCNDVTKHLISNVEESKHKQSNLEECTEDHLTMDKMNVYSDQ